jgi:glucokinase
VNLANILDPEVLVVGGGLATMGDLLVVPVRRHFAALLYAAEHRPVPRVELAALGERAGAIGAALLATLEG